jgi:hypothetical protein
MKETSREEMNSIDASIGAAAGAQKELIARVKGAHFELLQLLRMPRLSRWLFERITLMKLTLIALELHIKFSHN